MKAHSSGICPVVMGLGAFKTRTHFVKILHVLVCPRQSLFISVVPDNSFSSHAQKSLSWTISYLVTPSAKDLGFSPTRDELQIRTIFDTDVFDAGTSKLPYQSIKALIF